MSILALIFILFYSSTIQPSKKETVKFFVTSAMWKH